MINQPESHQTLYRNAKIFLATIASILVSNHALVAGDLNIADHSIRWTGSTVVKSHTGLLSPKSFSAAIADDGSIEALKVVLDMESIDVTDLQGRGKDRLTGHLKSEDFFHVSEYQEASFVMTEYKDGKMHGTFTVRGVPQPIGIPVTVTGSSDTGWKLSGSFAFDRQRHNVNYANAGIIGIAKDKIIDDDIQLEIELVLK